MPKGTGSRQANLIGIGAPRTATSSLARMLQASQEVFVPEEKELNGFGIDTSVTAERYDMSFAKATVEQHYLADITPVYLSNEQMPERIRSYNPDARIIATLREPVSRVVSQYRHMKSVVDTSLGPDLALDIESYVKRGLAEIGGHSPAENTWYSAAMNIRHSLYGSHLSRYYRCFPRDRILVLIYEDLTGPTPAAGKGVWEQQLKDFLGVTTDQTHWQNRAEGFETEISEELKGELRTLFAPEVALAGELIGRDLAGLWGY
ncbi:sulfotransferase domain-containing protein [Hoeflea marina]|uniref:Sulfotransferase domain-containing protein n=1 Tax=Hoeflea marina TaxID=274592 RepID=A0A317PFJ2_9HYPH|nr:sulfotransferase [Hoeflea marina]PWV98726.1 sulfotransferase domain-containing protein [Hoeflea marina]